jgi:hypothetical protein
MPIPCRHSVDEHRPTGGRKHTVNNSHRLPVVSDGTMLKAIHTRVDTQNKRKREKSTRPPLLPGC